MDTPPNDPNQPQSPIGGPGDPDPTAPTVEQSPGEPRRLTRSRTDRVLGGVCGGVARYFGIDPVIARIAAVGLVLLGGAGVLL
nr:PspC domain-containing protein [Thermoleophilaceae bacterium]